MDVHTSVHHILCYLLAQREVTAAPRKRYASFRPWATNFEELHTKSVKKIECIFSTCVFVYFIYAVYCKNPQNWNFRKNELFKTRSFYFFFFLHVKESTCRGLSTLVAGCWGGFLEKGSNQGLDCGAAQV